MAHVADAGSLPTSKSGKIYQVLREPTLSLHPDSLLTQLAEEEPGEQPIFVEGRLQGAPWRPPAVTPALAPTRQGDPPAARVPRRRAARAEALRVGRLRGAAPWDPVDGPWPWHAMAWVVKPWKNCLRKKETVAALLGSLFAEAAVKQAAQAFKPIW
eukprot:Skav230256  [mRNA]  locus=scaffold3387:68821:74922:+ [translate_table: standard]